jgi:hypothetical protein
MHDADPARSVREPAPPYMGEGAFALWHLSEDPTLMRFEPRRGADGASQEALVWAVDTRHTPLYWFPRDCPRGCVWTSSSTTAADRERFFAVSAATRIHVIESSWLEAVRACRLFAYELPREPFVPHGVGGFYVAREAVDAIGCHEVGDLLAQHTDAGIELRVTPSLWPFWRRVADSTLEFSGCRLRNAAPHPDQFD